jgi:hypothetical protein
MASNNKQARTSDLPNVHPSHKMSVKHQQGASSMGVKGWHQGGEGGIAVWATPILGFACVGSARAVEMSPHGLRHSWGRGFGSAACRVICTTITYTGSNIWLSLYTCVPRRTKAAFNHAEIHRHEAI